MSILQLQAGIILRMFLSTTRVRGSGFHIKEKDVNGMLVLLAAFIFAFLGVSMVWLIPVVILEIWIDVHGKDLWARRVTTKMKDSGDR
jgi:hypothetical protein